MREFWASVRRAFTSRYVSHLEAENQRLRTEFRQAIDALLVKNGQLPLTPREPRLNEPLRTGKPLSSQAARAKSLFTLKRSEESKPS